MAKKLITAGISLVIAFALWMYVVMVIGPEYKDTIRNVPVKLVGELNSDFMILGDLDYTIEVTLSGNRSDLNKLNSSNIFVELDLSKIQSEGTTSYRYEVQVPDSVTIESRSPAGITLEVVRRKEKTVPIEFRFDEDMIPSGYGILPVDAEMDEVKLSGPEEVIDRIAVATVDIEITDKNNKSDIVGTYDMAYLDSEGRVIEQENIQRLTVGADRIDVILPIQIKKELPLKLYIKEGGGLTEANVTVEPSTITVLGKEEDLATLDSWFLNSQDDPLDLSELMEGTQIKYPIDLPRNIKNKSGYEEATAFVSFEGVVTDKISIPQEQIRQLNIPEGLLPEITQDQITITVRGSAKAVSQLKQNPENIVVSVDFSNAKLGQMKDWVLQITIRDNPRDVGVITESGSPYTVFVEILDEAAVLEELARQEQQQQGSSVVTLL